jgi:putative oxidoreductase
MQTDRFRFGRNGVAALSALYGSGMARGLALLMLRAMLAVGFIGHGSQKLFGWFDGLGLDGTASYFESVGLSPGQPLALLSGLAEFGGGILIGLGLLTPLASLVLVVNMVVAIATVNSNYGFFSTDGQNGFELPLTFATIAAAIGLLGPGPLSVDRRLGLGEGRGRGRAPLFGRGGVHG